MTNEQLMDAMRLEGYGDLCWIQGKLCGTISLFTTTALVVGFSEYSYERRYCYVDRRDTVQALQTYTNLSEHPSGNWVKVKGVMNNRVLDDVNPNWSNL